MAEKTEMQVKILAALKARGYKIWKKGCTEEYIYLYARGTKANYLPLTVHWLHLYNDGTLRWGSPGNRPSEAGRVRGHIIDQLLSEVE